MTKPYSVAFKQKMVQRLTGKNAVSAAQLAQQTGVRQQNLSRWLMEARSLPFVTSRKSISKVRTVEHKARRWRALPPLYLEEHLKQATLSTKLWRDLQVQRVPLVLKYVMLGAENTS